ncbi:MAG TPA: type II toxin-antitoxin system prevent-host-death family antitoxin [Candidatus Angelobacter sp.]|nr:type II toxin-antitoxin system prevent-host-death family antitoxin [Candidatus Angelobacter sp.]
MAKMMQAVKKDQARSNRGQTNIRSVTRNRQSGKIQPVASYAATKAKNEFGNMLEKVIQGETVMITKHDAPKAVMISIGQFNSLSRSAQSHLDSLSSEFDALLARMQSSDFCSAMDAAFRASPRQLGKAAVVAARNRG